MIDFLFGAILVAGGVHFLVAAGRHSALVRRSRSWSAAVGQVIHARFERPAQRSRIVYEYRIGPRIFRGAAVELGPAFEWRARAMRLVRVYREHMPVVVWFDPDDPYRCCLERRNAFLPAKFVVGVGFSVIGLCVMIGTGAS